MSNRKSVIWTRIPMLGFLLLLACSSAPPALESKPAGVPTGMDLGGQWVLRETAGSRRAPRADMEPPIVTRQRIRSSRETARGRDTTAHVFLEYGENLKISQTDYSLFISYDRAIVREYTFGGKPGGQCRSLSRRSAYPVGRRALSSSRPAICGVRRCTRSGACRSRTSWYARFASSTATRNNRFRQLQTFDRA